MPVRKKIIVFSIVFDCIFTSVIFSQNPVDPCEQSSTVILFRTFDIFSFDRSYKIYSNDSLLGRIQNHDVIVLNTFENNVTLHAKTKAPSANAGHKASFQKHKKINYAITLEPGQVYFVKCGYLEQNLFDLPRQPTIRLLKPREIEKYLKKRFLRKKIKAYLYQEWLTDKKVIKLANN